MQATEPILQQMRTVAIAGAGVGTAIILGLLQLSYADGPVMVAVYATAVAIPAWVASWQYVQVFLVKGEASFDRFSTRAAASLTFIAGGSLAVAIGALIWHFSPGATAFFAISCLFSLIFASSHSRSLGA